MTLTPTPAKPDKKIDLVKLPLAVAWHLIPLAPLYLQRWPLFCASLLLVFVPYIKIKKLSLQLGELEAAYPGARPAHVERELKSFYRALALWRTFALPWLAPGYGR